MAHRRSVASVASAGILALALLFAVFARQWSGSELAPRSLAASAQLALTPTVASIDDVVIVTPTIASIDDVVVQPTVVPATATAEPTALATAETEKPTAATTTGPISQTVLGDPRLVAGGLDALDVLLDAESGIFGVMVLDADGDLRYSRNADTPFISASLYKLLLAADILGRIERGDVLFNQELLLSPEYFPNPSVLDGYYTVEQIGTTITVREALWATICVSSNVSALALLDLTTTSDLNTLAMELGLQDTRFNTQLADLPNWDATAGDRSRPDQFSQAISLIETEALQWTVNLTTPANMALFLELVLDGEIINGVVSNQLLELLLDQQIVDRIPALLPAGIEVAHKTGNLESIVHDVGVIMTGEGPVILVAMAEGVPDEEHATEIIQKIAGIVFESLGAPSTFD